MSEPIHFIHPKQRLAFHDIEGFEALLGLALDMRSSWNHATDWIWRQLDEQLWSQTRNPWVVLQTVSADTLRQVLGDADVRRRLATLVEARRQAAEAPAWFQQAHPQAPLGAVAYFSMEFMLGESLPIYSGGLGNVAGDQLKAAGDLGVPVYGIGLLYQSGYFRQTIDSAGAQRALNPFNDPGQLPVTPLRQADGEWLRVRLELPGQPIWLRAWQVQVGRVRLFLLDSNDMANYPVHRGITSQLYGGGSELRLTQELVLGIGGWQLLRALGLQPEVCHLNEGHAAFAVLERARQFMADTGQPFDVTLAATRAGNLFTTHTAVTVGFDRFAPALVEQYLGAYAEQRLGISRRALLALGRLEADNDDEPFNMAWLAIRGSGAVNGVSRLHGAVSRALFAPLFPRWPLAEVPVGHITNGVHMPTWDSAQADELWTTACGKNRWSGTVGTLGEDIACVSDAQLWQFRTAASAALVDYARARLVWQMGASGAPEAWRETARHVLDCNTLTLGFARRFVAYKRPNLLLHDPQRLIRLLTHPQRPVQLILAGKAHPEDRRGQAMIRQWVEFVRRPEVRHRAVFLADYDMQLTERLVQGVDVWLNTPRRPWEACGTSGMKTLVNGGLNLSVLDGWWAEAYTPEVGWALGNGEQDPDEAVQDARDAEALYALLENEVVPQFYQRDAQGIPTAWVARMRQSMARLTPQYSAARTVREYTETHYLPAAVAYRERAAERGARAAALVRWQRELDEKWASLRIGEVRVTTQDGLHQVEAQLYLGDLDADAVRVELYADGQPAECRALQRAHALVGATHGYAYRLELPAERPAGDYTLRVVPAHPDAKVPLESAHILWER